MVLGKTKTKPPHEMVLLKLVLILQLTSTPSDVVWCSPTILAAGLFRASSVRCQPSAAVSTLNLRPPPAGGSAVLAKHYLLC